MTSRKLVLIWRSLICRRTQRHSRAMARNEMPTRPGIGMLQSDAISAHSLQNHKLFRIVPFNSCEMLNIMFEMHGESVCVK